MRSRTLQLSRISSEERAEQRALSGPTDHARPRTRAECVLGTRPCPFVGCKWNLYLDVMHTGNVKLNFPELEPEEMGVSCVLDVTDDGPASLEDIGRVMNITRERARQIEEQALRTLLGNSAVLREAGP